MICPTGRRTAQSDTPFADARLPGEDVMPPSIGPSQCPTPLRLGGQGGACRVDQTAGGNQITPPVATDADGDIAVAWQRDSGTGARRTFAPGGPT